MVATPQVISGEAEFEQWLALASENQRLREQTTTPKLQVAIGFQRLGKRYPEQEAQDETGKHNSKPRMA